MSSCSTLSHNQWSKYIKNLKKKRTSYYYTYLDMWFFKLMNASESVEGLLKTDCWASKFQQVQGEAREHSLLTSSQVLLMLLVLEKENKVFLFVCLFFFLWSICKEERLMRKSLLKYLTWLQIDYPLSRVKPLLDPVHSYPHDPLSSATISALSLFPYHPWKCFFAQQRVCSIWGQNHL